ncbi:MAG: carbon-nitrogen hydrolase family protein [Gammaproteobacteria bacterium]
MTRVACIQMASGPAVSANLLEAERLISIAVQEQAGLVILPENFAIMGETAEDTRAEKEQIGDGPIQTFLAAQAKRHGIWIVGGTIPIASDDPSRIRAASLLFNDQGQMVARYDKIHLFDVSIVDSNEKYSESETIERGNEVVVVDTPFGKLGIAVCYDLRFPEQFRSMLDKGVEIIVLPSAFTAETGRSHWDPLIKARAIENLSYVVAAAQGGFHVNGRETYGHSMIVDPWGNMLVQRPGGTGVVCADIDLDRLHHVRKVFPCVDHRVI